MTKALGSWPGAVRWSARSLAGVAVIACSIFAVSAETVRHSPLEGQLNFRDIGGYAWSLRSVMNPDQRPLKLHSSHGIHRNSTATALLQLARGVPWKTARAENLLSNALRADELEWRIAELRALTTANQGIPEDVVDTTSLGAFHRLEGSYIDASLSVILAEYGFVERILSDGLGAKQKELAQLRSELLV